jgi:hypothetical protein
VPSFPVHLPAGNEKSSPILRPYRTRTAFSRSTHRDAQDRHPTALRSRRISGRDFDLPCARLWRELPERPRRILAASVAQKIAHPSANSSACQTRRKGRSYFFHRLINLFLNQQNARENQIPLAPFFTAFGQAADRSERCNPRRVQSLRNHDNVVQAVSMKERHRSEGFSRRLAVAPFEDLTQLLDRPAVDLLDFLDFSD